MHVGDKKRQLQQITQKTDRQLEGNIINYLLGRSKLRSYCVSNFISDKNKGKVI
jgi:hypothetical protein